MLLLKKSLRSFYRNYEHTLFALFVFLLPWQTVWIVREVFINGEKWHYGTISIYASDIVLVAWLVLMTWHYWQSLWHLAWQHWILFASAKSFILLTLFGSFWSPDPLLTIANSAHIALALWLFFVLLVTRINWQRVALVFVFSMTLQSAIALAQFTTQTMSASSLLGISAHDTWRGGSAIITADTGRWLRAYGAMPHPNILGGFLTLALTIAFRMTLHHKRYTQHWHYRFLLTSIILLSTALTLTFSRTAWLLGALCIGVLGIMSQTTKRKQLFLPLITLIATISTIIILYAPLFTARFTTDTTRTHISVTDRTQSLNDATSLIKKAPIIGVGGGASTLVAYHTLSTPQRSAIWQFQPAHNTALLFVTEYGIIGAALFALFIFCIANIYIRQKAHTSVQHIALLLLVLIVLAGLTDHWPLTTHSGPLLLALLCGALLKLPTQENKKSIR